MSAPASLVQDLLDEVQTALGDLVPNLYLAALIARE